MLVVSGETQKNPWEGRIIDLRIEDSADPLGELKRLLVLNRAYNLMNEGDALVTAGDMEGANRAYSAAADLAPGNHEMVFWRAATLAAAGDVEAALPYFKEAFDAWPLWRKLVPRLPHSGILPDDPALIARVLAIE
jgi:tetratricopeptide (TPR) repeat protein